MNLLLLKRIVAISQQTTAVYVDGEGALCPLCIAFGGRPRKGRVTSNPGGGVRYHVCPECGNTFKSIEHKPVIAESIKTTETLVLPKKTQ